MASTASGGVPGRLEDWHARTLSETLEQLDAEDSGLSQDEAKARLDRFGRNTLPEQPAPTVLEIILRQFKSPLIYILVAAAVVAIAVGDFKDAIFIGLVLAINAASGGYQEWRAEQSSRALQKMLQIRASVYRDGEVFEISAEEVVPGDIVWVESGNRVPADLRLLSAHGLEVGESFLTGDTELRGTVTIPGRGAPSWPGWLGFRAAAPSLAGLGIWGPLRGTPATPKVSLPGNSV